MMYVYFYSLLRKGLDASFVLKTMGRKEEDKILSVL